MFDIIKVNVLAFASLIISYNGVSKVLELLVIGLSISFTFYKFYINNKNK
mgnify:CR=1 FL=1|tara:strand:- start:331 stop:480 length:150 start_codon:yes stop_codon:yes gene_type:complete